MKVVEENVVRLHRDGIAAEFNNGSSGAMTRFEADGERTHDPHGLVISLILCMGCWAALAYFLLT